MGDFRDCRNLFCGRDCEGRHRVGFANSQHRIDGSLAPCGTGGRYFNNSCDLNKHMAVVFWDCVETNCLSALASFGYTNLWVFCRRNFDQWSKYSDRHCASRRSTALFAISGLTGLKFTVPIEKEKKWNPVIGFTSGIISGATAIFVVPVVPYLQSIDFSKGQSPSSENGFDPTRASNETAEKDALIQALGLTVLISSGALAVGLNARGELPASIILPGIIATVTAILGMVAGRTIRNAMSLDVFRKWVLAGLLVLGFVMIFRAFLA